jgi:hypothetical protein
MDVGALITLLLPLFFEKINPHTQKAIRENFQKQYELSRKSPWASLALSSMTQ